MPSFMFSPSQSRAMAALENRRFFKLICGASFTDTEKIADLVRVYTLAGADCIDISPDLAVIQAVEGAFKALSETVDYYPILMVSIPLDPDPHFRKIQLIEPDCILCGACVPVCPTEAITLEPKALDISQPLCYGCGRCVAICPPQALVLEPFLQEETLLPVLSHPLVEAVEIHTHFADPYMLPEFLNRFGEVLQGKLISLCFRPAEIAVSSWLPFLESLHGYFENIQPDFPLIIQIDGKAMSGTADPEASLPALKAAQEFWIVTTGGKYPWVTLSGGINVHTARYLELPENGFIRGVGMGTVARQVVWPYLEPPLSGEAMAAAHAMIQPFRRLGIPI